MIADKQAAKMVRWEARPWVPAVIALLAAFQIVYDAVGSRASVREVLIPMAVGLPLGLLLVGLAKLHMRRHMEYYVTRAAMDIEKGYGPPSGMDLIARWILLLVVVLWLFPKLGPHDLLSPGSYVPGILWILVMPEQLRIWRAAKARLVEMYADKSEASG